METQYRVAVAHYGHPALDVKHWAIVVMLDTSENGLVYQITGSTTTYELKPTESITLLDSATYLGKVDVGSVHKDRLPEFGQIIASGRITHGNVYWNCQNWVVERLQDLRGVNHAIRDVDQSWLLEKLNNSRCS